MNWEAIGAVGEVVGAVAVLVTLVFLLIQIRHSTKAMEESNRIEKVVAIDRHGESIGRWRGRLASDEALMRIWDEAERDEPLDRVSYKRFTFTFIDFVNIQRANFRRAQTVGAEGLAQHALMAVAVTVGTSNTMAREWSATREWHALESPEFVDRVEELMANPESLGLGTRYVMMAASAERSDEGDTTA